MPVGEGPEYDDDSGDTPTGPTPDPDDRLWRHPSELPRHPGTHRLPPIGTTGRREGRRPRVRAGRQLVGAVVVAGIAGAAAVLVLNGLVLRHGSRDPGPAASKSTTPDSTATAYVTEPTGASSLSPSVAVGSGVESMIYGLLPGIVAVDVAGPLRDQQGTGLVVRQDGMILTNSTLVSGATTITVTSSDGQEWNANLVGTDPATGVAVISVPASGLTVLPVDSEGDVQAGELSVAVCASSSAGGPFQASIGLFSAVDQQVDFGAASLMDAIVTSSAPPDATGGIIFDDQGRVVGILQSVLSADGSTQGVATPISAVQEAADSLMAGQEVVHAWLGIAGAGNGGGALVDEVIPASPAAAAGIHPGDVVTSIDNQRITSMAALSADVGSLQPGATVLLSLQRGGTSLEVSATLGGQPGTGP